VASFVERSAKLAPRCKLSFAPNQSCHFRSILLQLRFSGAFLFPLLAMKRYQVFERGIVEEGKYMVRR